MQSRQQIITKINKQLIKRLLNLSLQEYSDKLNKEVYQIELSFKDEFMRYVDIETFSIHYRLLEKHKILKFESVKEFKQIIECKLCQTQQNHQCKYEEGVDYIILQNYDQYDEEIQQNIVIYDDNNKQINPGKLTGVKSQDFIKQNDENNRQVLQQIRQTKGGTQRKDYYLTPETFKKICMRAQNTDRFADYFLFLEKIVKNYNDYQLQYKDYIMNMKDDKIDFLTNKVSRIEQQNNKLLDINKNQDKKLDAMNTILNRINKNVERKTQNSVYDINQLKKSKKNGIFVLTLTQDKLTHRIYRCQQQYFVKQLNTIQQEYPDADINNYYSIQHIGCQHIYRQLIKKKLKDQIPNPLQNIINDTLDNIKQCIQECIDNYNDEQQDDIVIDEDIIQQINIVQNIQINNIQVNNFYNIFTPEQQQMIQQCEQNYNKMKDYIENFDIQTEIQKFDKIYNKK